LKSQLSFTNHDSLARINEVNETPVHDGSGHSFSAASFGAATTDSWDDGSGSIGFTVTRPSKRSKDMDSGLFSQVQFICFHVGFLFFFLHVLLL